MKCKICGKEIEKSNYLNEIICSKACFNRDFWNGIVSTKDRILVINGHAYALGDENDEEEFRGFCGRYFKIRKLDTGEIIETTNLWLQGKVPDEYLELLQDNAEFIK